MSEMRSVEVADMAAVLDEGIATADARRAEQLDRARQLRAARVTGLSRERARLADELGDEDPRGTAVDGRLAGERTMAIELAAEANRARIEPAEVDEGAWVLYGLVLTEEHEPAPGLTV